MGRRAFWKAEKLKNLSRCGWLFLGLAALTVFTGCRLFGSGHGDGSAIRLIDAVPDAAGLRVAVDGKRVFTGCRFRADTGYQGIPPGYYEVYAAAEREGKSAVHLPIESVSALSRHRYTAVALGIASGSPRPRLLIFDDRAPAGDPTPKDQAAVSVVSAIPDAGQVDVALNGIVAFKNLRFSDRSEPLSLQASSYEWTVKEAGDYVVPLAGPSTLRLERGKSYLIVLMGRASDQTVSIQEYCDE
ncbi:MAG TPA: DUF4397 domain-containing protein [Capsulimonadaceae bacterium]|nr:DUF4397 domain-containing protein [Capsulimonadaceae bacterium]